LLTGIQTAFSGKFKLTWPLCVPKIVSVAVLVAVENVAVDRFSKAI
jgi:ABC-type Fe3+ transport system permease subunit